MILDLSSTLGRATIDTSDASSGGAVDWLAVLRPKIEVRTGDGPPLVSWAPRGDPGAAPWIGIALVVGVVAVLALAVYGAARLVR